MLRAQWDYDSEGVEYPPASFNLEAASVMQDTAAKPCVRSFARGYTCGIGDHIARLWSHRLVVVCSLSMYLPGACASNRNPNR